MYEVDDRDRVVELPDIPQSSVGAPIPLVIADEHATIIAFLLQNTPQGWDRSSVRVIGPDSVGEPIAMIHFRWCYAHMFGPPNDESFHGHPLAARGLNPYGAYLIEDSSWIRRLEAMNSVHPHHDHRRFENRKHIVLAFHDSTFECVTDGYATHVREGSILGCVPEMLELLQVR